VSHSDLHVVTGAFGYSGKYIASLLLQQGQRVRTLTGHPNRPNPFGNRVEALPFHFDNPQELTANLRGAAALYNTYWVRFSRGRTTFDQAVANTRALIRAAADAGVGRFINISITNPAEDSPLPYFRGKAVVERALTESGLSYAILRPTVLFGKEDILVNNIAWLLRRLPVFGVFGSGEYRLPAGLALAVGRVVGWLVRDVVITPDEIAGLMANLLVSDRPPTCPTRLSEWLHEHADRLGARYASELKRHYRRA